MSQNLDKMFKQIQKNSEKLAMMAMMKAAENAYEMAKRKTQSCLKTYLKRKPKVYKRINPSPLSKACRFSRPKLFEKHDLCVITFSMQYNSEWIKGEYKSNSWWHKSGNKWISRFDEPDKFHFDRQDNGIPDSGWILNNYLEGKHPGWFNGVDRGWQDAEKPAETMKNFFEKELHEEAGTLIYEAMQGVIIDFLKTNGGGK